MNYHKTLFKRHFYYNKRYWYKNIKNIPKYFRAIKHLFKYGYDDCAIYETFAWFTITMKSILKRYKKNYISYPVFIVDGKDTSAEQWDCVIDHMVNLLDKMDEDNPNQEEMMAAKDEFFELFSEHFYDLWD